jgi:hypothetical protein
VDVDKAGWSYGEVANWRNGLARHFRGLAVLASSGPSAAVFLDGWPHEVLGEELSRLLDSGVAEGM